MSSDDLLSVAQDALEKLRADTGLSQVIEVAVYLPRGPKTDTTFGVVSGPGVRTVRIDRRLVKHAPDNEILKMIWAQVS